MVGRDDEDRLIPVAVGFDPADNGSDGRFAAIDRADGIVEIIGVESKIDVAGLDEQGERLVGIGTSTVRAASVIWAKVGCSIRSAGVYHSAGRSSPLLLMLGAGS